MNDVAYIAQLVAAAFFLIVGVRLLQLGRQTGETPEQLLGVYFLVTGFSYLGWMAAAVFPLGDMQDPIDLLSWGFYSIGVVPFLYFIRIVFRPNSAWAVWLAGACTLMLFAAMTSWIIQGHGYYVVASPWFWCQWLGYTIPCVWMTAESLVAHRLAKRRVRVGLCDSIVANRYLLFGIFGAFQTFACATDVFISIESSSSQAGSAMLDFVLGSTELVGIAMLFLIFFPPDFYRRWIASSAAPAAETVEG